MSSLQLTGVVATEASARPTVRAGDERGYAVAGARVVFVVKSGGGRISSDTVLTDASGIASVAWTLGTIVGPNVLAAQSASATPVTFTVSAVAGPLAKIVPAPGGAQIARAGTVLPQPLKAKTQDAYGNAVAGARVTFSVVTGGGTLSSIFATSDDSGSVSSGLWQLGPASGVQRARAVSGTLAVDYLADTFDCPSGTPANWCDGSWQLLFASVSDAQIYRVNLDGSGRTRLTSDGTNASPAVSPDGRRVAFVRYTAGGADVYVMNADGSGVVRRTTGGRSYSATWSPDGKKLAVSDEGLYQSSVSIMSADADGTAAIDFPAYNARSPSWSPDGKKIAFVVPSGDDGYDAHGVMTLATGVVSQLSEWRGYRTRPSWSPDGRQLVSTVCNSDFCDAVVMDAVSGAVAREIRLNERAFSAAFSPDGLWLAIQSRGSYLVPSENVLSYVPVEGGPQRVIVTDARSFSWAR